MRRTLRDWFFVINTAQLFCIDDRMWYLINSPEFQSVILALAASVALGKHYLNDRISSYSTFHNLSFDITVSVGFLENSECTVQIHFLWRTPMKVWTKVKLRFHLIYFFILSLSYSASKGQNFSRPRREEFKAYVKNVPIDMTKVSCLQFVKDTSAGLEIIGPLQLSHLVTYFS